MGLLFVVRLLVLGEASSFLEVVACFLVALVAKHLEEEEDLLGDLAYQRAGEAFHQEEVADYQVVLEVNRSLVEVVVASL